METAVAFRAKLDGELSASLVASLLQFLLFMRGQLPRCVVAGFAGA